MPAITRYPRWLIFPLAAIALLGLACGLTPSVTGGPTAAAPVQEGIPAISLAQAQVKTIAVDCDSQIGSFRGLYNGVNAGPYSLHWDNMDLISACDELGLSWFRTHDLGTGIPSPGDIPQIYGNTDVGDISDPDNYYFSAIDPLIAEANDGGYNIFYRLGHSFCYPPLDASTDPTRWAEVAHHIINAL